jgi:hypothetical protein
LQLQSLSYSAKLQLTVTTEIVITAANMKNRIRSSKLLGRTFTAFQH